ncbi:MAG: hypothetical protein NT116_02135 [Candidatus Parcubacteria bacterium]|nr:hypothetical protein [Candidatus Parcubacteria bacterium]
MEKFSNFLAKNLEFFILIILMIILLAFVCVANFYYQFAISGFNAFPELAQSFLHGHINFIKQIKNVDVIKINDLYYWHMPPLPALILIPFTFIFKTLIPQNLASLISNILLFCLIFIFTNRFVNTKKDRLWLTLMYFFASVYVASIFFNGPYYFAHIVTTILIFLSLLEFFGKKRFWLIGILSGLILLTRLTASLTIIFFILAIIFDNTQLKNKVKNLIFLFIPVIICFLLLCGYNYLRFNNFFESGYTLTNAYQKSTEVHPYGQFSLKYIPANFYYYFIESFQPFYISMPPDFYYYQLAPPYILPDPTGSLSFFIISPLFLLIFKADLKKKIIKYILITSLIILLILLSYYWNGWPQIGPRYMNDFLPLLFTILLFQFKDIKLKKSYKLIIAFSALLNVYLCLALLNLYLGKI